MILKTNSTGQYKYCCWFSLVANTTGTQNTSVGYNALTTNTTGDYNTVVGLGALRDNVSSNNNIALARKLN